MKMKARFVAGTVIVGLLSGATVATADSPSRESGLTPRRSVELSTAAASSRAVSSSPGQMTSGNRSTFGQASETASAAARRPNRVGLRAVKPCVFRGRPTMCVIKVRRLEQRPNRVVALGTITPRSNPAIHIPFQKRVVGVRDLTGVHGLQQAPSCAILSLVLGPLHLDVLGLVIDLNRVVLNIIGQTGAGNLLGNLLCALTGILDGGVLLTRFLSVVTELLAAINAVLAL